MMENGGGKAADCSHFRASVTLKPVSYSFGGDGMFCHRKWSVDSVNCLFSQLQHSDGVREGECEVLKWPQDDTVGHKHVLLSVIIQIKS